MSYMRNQSGFSTTVGPFPRLGYSGEGREAVWFWFSVFLVFLWCVFHRSRPPFWEGFLPSLSGNFSVFHLYFPSSKDLVKHSSSPPQTSKIKNLVRSFRPFIQPATPKSNAHPYRLPTQAPHLPAAPRLYDPAFASHSLPARLLKLDRAFPFLLSNFGSSACFAREVKRELQWLSHLWKLRCRRRLLHRWTRWRRMLRMWFAKGEGWIRDLSIGLFCFLVAYRMRLGLWRRKTRRRGLGRMTISGWSFQSGAGWWEIQRCCIGRRLIGWHGLSKDAQSNPVYSRVAAVGDVIAITAEIEIGVCVAFARYDVDAGGRFVWLENTHHQKIW